MYDELIAELRQHHCDAKEDDTQEVCEECSYDVIIVDKSAPSGFASVCVCGLMNRAADAIEELQKAVNFHKPITNADRIRAMTDEELAEMWWEIVDCGECVPGCGGCNMTEKDCKYWVLAWLKEEVMNNGLCEPDTETDSEG